MVQPHSVSNREQVIDTMIELTRLSSQLRAIVAGSDSLELYLALRRRGFIRVATTETCRVPTVRRFRRSSSAATRRASGLPVTPRGGSAEFSCSRTPQRRLQKRIASLEEARPYSPLTGSNSIWKTTAIRLPCSLDR